MTSIYATQYRRTQATQATAAPLATSLSLQISIIATTDGAPDHAERVARAILTEHSGETVLVVGHSDTVPAIVRALGGTAPEELEAHEYNDLFIVTVMPGGGASTIRAKYGGPNPSPG